MTSEQIKEVSLKHFAQYGYEGASLAQIANDVGIKKQSIYTHFKGKDELFLQLCRDARENEFKFVMDFRERNSDRPIQAVLYDFLLKYIDRYEKYMSTKFWIRTAFFPPAHLYDQVMKDVNDYLDHLEKLLLPIMKKALAKGEVNREIGEQRATVAFLALIDGIFVEMIYGSSERLQKRLDASWHVYWRGLSRE